MTSDPGSLANLRDIALPPSVAWWPPTVGWWIVGAGILALVALGVAGLWRRYRANAYRRAALVELRRIATEPAARLAPPLAALLKRVALAAYPRPRVAGLTGPDWLRFLDARNPGFDRDVGSALNRAALDPAHPLSAADANAALDLARRWIRRHRR